MRNFDRSTADRSPVGDVEVARWEQYVLGDALPFGAMWYTVPPGSTSPVDCHPELELSIVVCGSALVEAGGDQVVVEQGGAFLLESGEQHVVHNRSTVPLVVFSAYWMPVEAAATAAGTEQAAHV